jgi:mannose-1-phosphate guanylyltransferase
MKIILLSGGSGKRLWPLTSSKRAKQYLPILDAPDGGGESLLQRVWRQLGAAGLQSHTHISTCLEQMELVQRQTGGQAGIVLEPEPRDTYPAVALAAAYLYSIAGVSLNETIVVMPVDAYVEADFFECIHELPELLRRSSHELITLTATQAAEQGHQESGRPNQERSAEEIRRWHLNQLTTKGAGMEAGASPNCGVYAFKLDFMIAMITRRGLPASYEELYKQYGRLPKTAFEAELQQRASAKTVINYQGNWNNLRSWKALSEKVNFQRLGRGDTDTGGANTTIMNELGIPITIVGLDHLLVAASPNGILIASKAAEASLEAKLQALIEPSSYEEYSWGNIRVIDRGTLSSGSQTVAKRIKVTAGHNMNYEMHFHRSEVWTILAGEGVAMIDERSFSVSAGDTVRIPERTRHSLLALADIELLEVQTGASIRDEDCIRLGSTWEEITGQMNMA